MKNSVLSRLTKRRVGRSRWRQTFAAILQAAMIEPRRVEITHQRIVIARLPREFHGFRIVQLSDIHHSPFLSEEEIVETARRANELKPDLIALTGDYVSHSRDYIAGCARALGTLRARHGVFAVLGNHDHWTDGEMIAAGLGEKLSAEPFDLIAAHRSQCRIAHRLHIALKKLIAADAHIEGGVIHMMPQVLAILNHDNGRNEPVRLSP